MPLPLALVGLGARLLPIGKKVGEVASKTVNFGLPLWVIVLAVVGGVIFHKSKVSSAYKSGVKAENARLAAEIAALGEKAKRQGEELAALVRRKFNEANKRTTAHANALSLRGPGKAEYHCPVAKPASGHDPAAAPADAGGYPVPDGDRLAVVPWGWLVSRAATCDLDRNEVIAWRDFYPQIVKLWGEKPK